MNGIELLKQDHRLVNGLFDQLESNTSAGNRKELFQQVRTLLEMHAHIEETVFYPFFSEREGFSELIQEAYDEHQDAKSLLLEISRTQDENEWENRLGELVKGVRHHVVEEEGELFPKVESLLEERELEILGQRFEEARRTKPESTAAA